MYQFETIICFSYHWMNLLKLFMYQFETKSRVSPMDISLCVVYLSFSWASSCHVAFIQLKWYIFKLLVRYGSLINSFVG
jgi:hypothetical protein